MMLQQAYYTAADVGLRGGSGFQINAASADLDPATLALIERYSGYQPPTHLAYDRSVLPGDFPHALTYYTVPGTGADANVLRVLAHSVYLGAEHAGGRGGNFFTHSIVSGPQPTNFGQQIPIEWWGWPGWVNQASPTTQLPGLTPSAIEHSLDIRQFLLSDARRLDYVEWLVGAALDCLHNRRRLLVIAPAAECAYWIAVVSMALPRALAYELTFTTYVRDPSQRSVHITGLDPKEYQTSGRQQMQPGWYLMHPERAEFTPGPPSSAFARFVADGYRHDRYGQVDGFRDWCNRLHTPATLDRLDALLDLYQLAQGAAATLERVQQVVAIVPALLDEQAVVLEPLFGAITHLDPYSPVTVDCVWSLAVAAGQSRTPVAQQTLAEVSVWLASRFLPIATPTALADLDSRLATTPLPLQQSEFLPALQKRLTGADTLTKFAAVTQLVRRLGLEGALQLWRRAGLTNLVAQSPTPELGQFFVQEIRRNDTDALVALFDGLKQLSGHKESLDRWYGVLADQTVQTALRRKAAESGHSTLGVYLAAQAARGSATPSADLGQLLQTYGTGQATLDAIQQLYIPLIYPHPVIARVEGTRLIETLDSPVLARLALIRKIARGLLADPSVGDSHYHQLVDSIARQMPDDPWLRTLSAWQNYRDPHKVTEVTGHLLVNVPPEFKMLRYQLLQITFYRLLNIPQKRPAINMVTYMLQSLAPSYDAEIWPALIAALEDIYQQKIADAKWFSSVFTEIAYVRRQTDKYAAVTILDAPLRAIWTALPRQERAWVNQDLGKSVLASYWTNWRDDSSLWDRVKSRLF